MNVTVLGSGTWGTALSIVLARNGHCVDLYGRDEEALAAMKSCRENLKYLPGFVLPEEITLKSFKEPLLPSSCYVLATPTVAIREVSKYIPLDQGLILAANKGLLYDSSEFVSQVLQNRFPHASIGVLSGPNLAIEVVRGIPAAAALAVREGTDLAAISNIFRNQSYRIYMSHDVVGVELAGALKNPLAIGAGISDSLGFGDNTKGFLLSRGLSEIIRLGLSLGAQLETFMGLAGVGDLFATANSKLSRNYRIGYALGSKIPLKKALKDLGQVAEGIPTVSACVRLARAHKVEMPVFEAIDSVIKGSLSPHEAVALLMERAPKFDGFSDQKIEICLKTKC